MGKSRRCVRRFLSGWRVSDIALPSLDDDIALFGDAGASAVLGRLRGSELTRGALKRGVEGSRPTDPALASAQCPPAPRVIDTRAAGESFNGGYLAAVLQRKAGPKRWRAATHWPPR